VLAHIAALIDGGGQITLGRMHPIKCAAIANDGHNSLATLQRRPQESLQQLLERLDEAIGLAWNKQEFTDEINTAMLTRPRR
jgi:ribosome assembly protein YihI (activator of Der GTPase)